MDTRFWGPSGWRLLHLITFAYDPKVQKKSVQEMFEMLPYVLPCKFCRHSLSEYMEEEPLEPALKSKETLSRWLYRIHNMVNAKLRSQSLTNEADPSYSSVQGIYEQRIAAGCTRVEFEGWDFLFSIVANHPRAFAVKGSTPILMDGTPPLKTTMSMEEKNRWNYMTAEERLPYWLRFWKALEGALPFAEWRTAWASCTLREWKIKKGPVSAKRELWRIRCCLEKKLELVNREQYDKVCKKLRNHMSGCHKTRRARTCRRITRKRNN